MIDAYIDDRNENPMESFRKHNATHAMNNPFMDGKKSLPRAWRNLRSLLTAELEDLSHLSMVCDFWKKTPVRARLLDWDSPSSWPDPWELMHEADFDESSVALGMFYTLVLSEDQRWSSDRLKLLLIRDREMEIQRLILMIDDRWLMNLDHGMIMEKDQIMPQLLVQQRYRYDGKSHSFER